MAGDDKEPLVRRVTFVDNLTYYYDESPNYDVLPKYSSAPSVYQMSSQFASIDIENLDERVARRDTIRLTDNERENKKRRLAVYNFLDHPRSATNFPYHFGIFAFVLTSVILSAVADASPEKTNFYSVSIVMELVLAVFFLVEFFVRIWSVSADARYQGYRGIFNYLTRPVCIIDVMIILVTIAIPFIDRTKHAGFFMDMLRFVQILRLFHIDRQMTTWSMIKKMTVRSSFELVAAYYISALLFLLLALTVYEVESSNDMQIKMNDTEHSSTFNHYGEAMWFSVVSFLTVGYGDIVPKHWLSKFLTCIFAYAAYCTFIAASTLVSVGLTLMIENETKDRQKSKIRHAAATVIQHWYRYHLATDRKERWNEIPYFRHVCFKLYTADERLQRNRAIERKMREKFEKKQEKKKKNLKHNDSHRSLESSIKKNPSESNVIPAAIKTSLRKISLGHNRFLSNTPIEAPRKEVHIQPPTPHAEHMERRQSTSTSVSSSFDLSDMEKEIEIRTLLESQAFDSKRPSYDLNVMDDAVLGKYRPLIRFFNFLLFQLYIRKFSRMRKPYQLMDAEAELIEMEHTRSQLFHELELRLEAAIGKPVPSPFAANHEGKVTLERRIQLCENEMEKMEEKLQDLMHLGELIGESLGLNEKTLAALNPPPTNQKRKQLKRQTTHYT